MAENDDVSQGSRSDSTEPDDNRKIALGYARGFMGGMLVGVPAMLTMELW